MLGVVSIEFVGKQPKEMSWHEGDVAFVIFVRC